MVLTIILTKEVADQAEAEALTAIVKQQLEQYPDVGITAEVHDKVETT